MFLRAVGCVLALALATACARDTAPSRGRVLLIGIDGATLRIARPLMNEGRLPNLTRMARSGYFGPLRSHFPLHSPRIWTSMATGKAPAKHGIEGFVYADERGVTRLYLSTDRVTHALWNIVSDAGLRVGVVNWWNSYPVEVVNGVIVSDHLLSRDFEGRRKLTGAAPVASGPITYPLEWHQRVRTLLESPEALTEVDDPFADAGSFPDWLESARLARHYRGDAAVTRIALDVERELHPDLMMVFLPGIDRVSHFAWAAVEPESAYAEPLPMTPAERRALRQALERYYEYGDALIGLLSAGYGSGDLVLVVSDHGFEAGRTIGALTGTHETARAQNGVVYAAGRDVGAPRQARPMSVNDVTPTILAWLGLPVGEDMDGQVASFLHVEHVTTIASHDTAPIERLAGGASGAEPEILEQLHALGYLEHGAGE